VWYVKKLGRMVMRFEHIDQANKQTKEGSVRLRWLRVLQILTTM
jgi:hypothetical protein